MRNTLNLSADSLEAGLVEVITNISTATQHLNIPFFIIGATARDLVMVYANGAPIERATRDVDFAVCVKSWDQYEGLQQKLISSGYSKDKRQRQRLLHPNGYVIDVIPFGPISDNGQIAWPPDWAVILSVIGFEDAFNTAIQIEIENSNAKALVADPSGIALLKLISWQERDYSIRPKDAQDLAYLCRHYCRLEGVSGKLYENGVMDRFDYEEELASGYLLGQEVALNASSQAISGIHSLMQRDFDNHGFDRLVEESVEYDIPSEVNKRNILQAFKLGFLDHSDL